MASNTRYLAAFLLLLAVFGLSSHNSVKAERPTPVPTATIFDVAATGGAAVMTSSKTALDDMALRVQVAITPGETDSVVSLTLGPSSTRSYDWDLNTSTALVAGDMATFLVLVPEGWQWNVKAATTTRITVIAQEVYEGQ